VDEHDLLERFSDNPAPDAADEIGGSGDIEENR
jgi:hypothetical protein